MLRTVILDEDGKGFQQVKDKDNWLLNIVDGSVYKDKPADLQNFVQQLITKPFDLAHDYMLKACLINIIQKIIY